MSRLTSSFVLIGQYSEVAPSVDLWIWIASREQLVEVEGLAVGLSGSIGWLC